MHHIRINAVCPGFIETPMLQRAGLTVDPARRDAIDICIHCSGLGRPEEVAAGRCVAVQP